MNKIKFVGGPFHGEEHEVDDDCVEMRLPVLKDTHGNIDYIRYTKPKENEFVFSSRDIGSPPESKPVIASPNIVLTDNFIFELVKLEKEEVRGYKDQSDWCKHKIVIKGRSDNREIVYKIWSFQNDYTVELITKDKYLLSYVDTKENKYILDFFYGMGKLLEQNGFVK